MKINVKYMADNIPGYLVRYGLREVEEPPEVPVCVVADGLCNHADTDIEDVKQRDAVLVCTNPSCGAWRYVGEQWRTDWNNEVILERK